jgi:centromeric protein E
MMGDDITPGVMSLAVKEIFNYISSADEQMEFLLRCAYIEIYNEKIFDLLEKDGKDLKLHEHQGETNVNSKEIIVTSEERVLELIETGNRERRTGGTNMNERSSRSHTIFRIILESRNSQKTDENDGEYYQLALVL